MPFSKQKPPFGKKDTFCKHGMSIFFIPLLCFWRAKLTRARRLRRYECHNEADRAYYTNKQTKTFKQ